MDVDSENEVDSKEHKKLLENILNLNSRQYINKTSRTESTAQISEYNLIKSFGNDKDDIRLHDLTKALKNRAVDVELRKKIKKAEVKSKTLAKPLDKPQADRIKRSTAYESTKKHLDRWEPVVTSNRVSTNLSFPLEDPNLNYKEARDFANNWVLKSNLEKELEKLEPKVETVVVETEKNVRLTLKEMIEKRKEMAKLRRYQSYKEIKTRWQNKIKSKKFRRILRKDKIKEQMKDFELLQKTNPEEALKKLDEIERARAEERASLKHKSTGKWARNQQVRAKFDKESRKALAEQLSISKNLLQKQVNESSESEDNDSDNINSQNIHGENGESVWPNEVKPSQEVEDFVSSYRKYWESQNVKNSGKIREGNETPTQTEVNENSAQKINIERTIDIKKTDDKILISSEEPNTKRDKNLPRESKKIKINSNIQRKIENKSTRQKKQKVEEKKHLEIDTASETWEVTTINQRNNSTVDDIFDDIEQKLNNRVDKKLEKIKCKLENSSKPTQGKSKCKSKKKENVEDEQPKISATQEDTRTIQNVEVPESKENINEQNTSNDLESLKSILESKSTSKSSSNANKNKIMEHDKYRSTKAVTLNTAMPDVLSYEDNEEMTSTGGIIMEAFKDNDIVDEFAKDKKQIINNDRPKDLDLTLPGWGSWGGNNIPISKKKKKRFILKAPKVFPRKDMNKGHLIINESANDNAKSHLVSEIPFPFKTVKDFEASLRAPIGNTFVPETAFRRNIKPTLRTRMGTIIEPITEDILLHNQKKK